MRARRLLVCLLLAASPARADTKTCRFSSSEMAADLSQLQQALAVRWAYAGVHAFGLRAVIDAERDKLPASADGETFALVLERILAQMHDGHGGVLVPCAKPPKRTLPFTIVDTLDGVLVDEPDEAALVARGDRLLAIDGKPIDELIAALETRTSAATDVGRRARVLRQLPSTNANEVEVTIADRFWQQRTVRLSTVSRSPLNDDDWIETRDLGDRVAYVHFKSFEPKIPAELRPITDKNLDRLLAPYYEKIDAAFLSFAASRALVIDLRGNVGGSDWLGRRVARHLLTTHSVYSWFSEKEGRWQAPKPNFLPAVLDPYDKHVIVLVDEITASAAENLAVALQDNLPNVELIGRPTAGTSGVLDTTRLSRTGALVFYAGTRVFGPKGEWIEGHGVTPNVLRARRRSDVLHGVDVDLAAALDLLGWRPRN